MNQYTNQLVLNAKQTFTVTSTILITTTMALNTGLSLQLVPHTCLVNGMGEGMDG